MGMLDKVKEFFMPLREAAGKTIEDDDEGWRRLTGDSTRDLAPITQRRAREISAWLWQANLLANRIIELPIAFILANGVKLTVPDPVAQKTLNRFWNDPINCMDLKLEKKVRELALYGEQCYPTFVNEISGEVRLGYLDPALIETVVADPDNREQPIGIVTVKDKHGRARRYRVVINGDEDVFSLRTQEIRASFSDGECFYFVVNDLSSGMRGRPDMTSSADWLDAYDDFLFGEQDRNKYLRAFVWDLTLKGADDEVVKKRAKEFTPPRPNSAHVHNDSETLAAVTPTLNSGDTSESARLLRNHVLGGATMPEHWFGGGGDVNRSTGESMSDPAFKVMSMRQHKIKHILEEIGRYVLRQKAVAEGVEIDFGEPQFQVNADFPEMISRDTTKYASALQQVVTAVAMAVDRKFMASKLAIQIIATIAGQLGVDIDPEQALADALKEAGKKAEDDVFTDPLTKDAADDQDGI